jgi:hypothetical protein
MKQEFITTQGKVILENNMVRIKKLIHRSNGENSYLFSGAFYCLFLLSTDSKITPLVYIMLGIICFIFFVILFELFFIKTWKNHFPIEQIKSYRVDRDLVGLETKVTLVLKSNRHKEIYFRNHEHQLDGFLEAVTKHITQTQFAH